MADEAVNTRPRRYFAVHFRLLRFLGLGWWHHPDEDKTENFPGWYLYYSIATQLVWVAGFVGLETIDPFVGEKEMDRFMFSLSFVITHNLTLIKLYLFFFRNNEIQEIVRILEIDLYQYYQNDAKNRRTVKISKTFTGAFLFFGWLTIGNSNLYGAIQDFHWKALVRNLNETSERPVRSLPQPIWIPWNYQQDKSFIPTFILETIGLLWTGHIVMTIDTFIGSVIFHMSSQFAILSEAIATAFDRTMKQLYKGVNVENQSAISNNNVENLSLMDEDENTEIIVRAFCTDKQIESALQTTLLNCFRQHQLLIGLVQYLDYLYSRCLPKQMFSRSIQPASVLLIILCLREEHYCILNFSCLRSCVPSLDINFLSTHGNHIFIVGWNISAKVL